MSVNVGPKPSGIQFTEINRQVLAVINKSQQIFNICAQKYLSLIFKWINKLFLTGK